MSGATFSSKGNIGIVPLCYAGMALFVCYWLATMIKFRIFHAPMHASDELRG